MDMKNVHGFVRTARQTVARWISPESFAPRPAYRDSTQISIKCERVITPSVYGDSGFEIELAKGDARDKVRVGTGEEIDKAVRSRLIKGWRIASISELHQATCLPTMSNSLLVYQTFTPTKAILSELVYATYRGDGLPDKTIAVSVGDASDLILVSAFAGAKNCFPNAPSEDHGIAGSAFARDALGNGISWPEITGGSHLYVSLAIEPSVLSRATGRCACEGSLLPSGYDPVPRSVKVVARLGLFGPSRRW